LPPNPTDWGILKEKDMSRFDKLTEEQWIAAFDEFVEKFNAPDPEPIMVLNLIMRKEFALQILKGEKKVEIRPFSEHYYNRLTDKKVDKWMDDHRDDEGMDKEAFEEFMCSTRPVGRIHFHNYNNSWFLDVRVTENALVGLTEDVVEDLQDRYDFHELDELLASYRKKEQGQKSDVVARPIFYYFGLGEVIDTNLKIE